MEVHHHPDLHHKKKNFKEYFFEFLMIFLAVTLGFFAETIRETITERNTSNEYARSMIEDLKKDTAYLNHDINELKFVDDRLDTFINIVHTKNIHELPGGTWSYYGRFGTRTTTFQTEDATMEQLKSSGALRYFGNYTIITALGQYDQSTKELATYINLDLIYQSNIVGLRNKIFDAYYILPVMDLQISKQAIYSFMQQNIPLLTTARNMMIEYASYCQLKSFNNKNLIVLEMKLFKNAKSLLTELNKKYKPSNN
jgi:DNA-binding MltR family transcriptional regulator